MAPRLQDFRIDFNFKVIQSNSDSLVKLRPLSTGSGKMSLRGIAGLGNRLEYVGICWNMGDLENAFKKSRCFCQNKQVPLKSSLSNFTASSLNCTCFPLPLTDTHVSPLDPERTDQNGVVVPLSTCL